MKSKSLVNEDLIKERKKCTFDIEEFTNFCDGSKQLTKDRREVEELVLACNELKDSIPEEYLSYKERYENAVRKACRLTQLLKTYMQDRTDVNNFGPSTTYKVMSAVIKDVTPFLHHMGMFIPTLLGQSSPEQTEKWLFKALNMEIIGTYAQTELGHGTFIRGLETTATYDPKTEEFVIDSPSITAYKWWPGGLGQTANHCIVVAQLYTKGVCHGTHPFVCQIRDTETHMPLPGVIVGDIGPKMAFQTANNGFLGFKNYRVPRENMLMKHAQITKDGTYVKSSHGKLTYGTMVFVRVLIVNDVAYDLAKASTIAVRYSAVRHQSQPKPDEPEPQILDYVTQQHKLFVCIATSHALRLTGRWLWTAYNKNVEMMNKGNHDLLPELHALACCLKAVSTRDGALCVEQCRLACGGHGFMLSSNLPVLYAHVTAANTYEGENTVLLLQTARSLVKAYQQSLEGIKMSPTLMYLNATQEPWSNTPEGIIRGLQAAAAGHIKSAVDAMQTHVKSGMDQEDAWNLLSVRLVTAAEAHCRAVICDVTWNENQRISTEVSKNLGDVLKQLSELYLTYWALEKVGDLLMFSNISQNDVEVLRTRYEQLLGLIRPNAVGLVDGFDVIDEILQSTLGAYDGRVYDRLMEEALKSPLNAEPVNSSFHKYLKPFMQGKL